MKDYCYWEFSNKPHHIEPSAEEPGDNFIDSNPLKDIYVTPMMVEDADGFVLPLHRKIALKLGFEKKKIAKLPLYLPNDWNVSNIFVHSHPLKPFHRKHCKTKSLTAFPSPFRIVIGFLDPNGGLQRVEPALVCLKASLKRPNQKGIDLKERCLRSTVVSELYL
jgi:hypothetical protein